MSKGLEALENILNQELIKPSKYRKTIRDIASVGQVIAIQKELKALEIIKEKRVDIGWLFASLNCSRYNLGVGKSQALKKKEYDLLKEALL